MAPSFFVDIHPLHTPKRVRSTCFLREHHKVSDDSLIITLKGSASGLFFFALLLALVNQIQFKFQVVRVPVSTAFRRGQYCAECGVACGFGVSCGDGFLLACELLFTELDLYQINIFFIYGITKLPLIRDTRQSAIK
ncbi:hypothetical protein DQZ83_22600 [Salmonella enterica subsp. enterica serovar Oranienburg]|nr:hypothetical protein [Salmonella enterica]EBQ9991664.1 hypothetical protein [Salmonella enterica subsp. enterica serovar Oranienburg]EBU9317633.1 hypothetical protein [Salmonella enterica subsp. enterica serovar Amager]EBU9822023.1 hypothetical protein [Salmonella enterica subsp. enterica serovar Newport]EBZ1027882.1 hypothetical protein [Salmonella enterica subsp. enterica serovar Muenchen]ECI3890350.1 hypothetical protein [Salmonella enterica subsp. enterica serovar Gombe]ECT5252669.1 hy